MTDPTYIYVKGSGWVPSWELDEVRYVDLKDGRKFKLTLRKALPGERCMQIGFAVKLMKLAPNGTDLIVDMDKVVDWFLVNRPRLRDFYLIPRNGYRYRHFTVVVENAL